MIGDETAQWTIVAGIVIALAVAMPAIEIAANAAKSAYAD